MTGSSFKPEEDKLGKNCSAPVHAKLCEPIDVNVLNQLDLAPVENLIQGVIDKLELGIDVNATQAGTWTIDVNNEVDIAEAIADKLDGLTVNVGNFPTELSVDITNQPIEVTIVNQPIEVDMKTAEPIVVCIENGLVDGVMTTKQALLHVVYNKDGDVDRDYLTDFSLNTITGTIADCKENINLGSSAEFCMKDVVFENASSLLANDDYAAVPVDAYTATINVLENDTGDIDASSVVFVESGTKVLNKDTTSSSHEFTIDEFGNMTYTTDDASNDDLHSVDYYVSDMSGNQSKATVEFIRSATAPD